MGKYIPLKLYKYKTIDKFMKSMLENQELYLASIQSLDDQYEGSFTFSKLLLCGKEEDYKNTIKDYLLTNINKLFERNITLDEFNSIMDDNGYVDKNKLIDYLKYNNEDVDEKNIYGIVKNINNIIKVNENKEYIKKLEPFLNMKELVGVCSLSEKKNLQTMWQFYGNYSGYCIEYDLFNFIKSNSKEYVVKKVKYKKKRKHDAIKIIMECYLLYFKKSNINKYLEKEIYDILTEKNIDWNFQREWRILGEKSSYVKVPIKAIYLGKNMNDELKKEMLEICKRNKYKAYEMYDDFSELKIIFKRLT